jgi:UPF0755 protein
MLRRLLLASAVLVLLGVALAAVAAHWALWRQLDNPSVFLEVEPGSSARRVLDQLAERGLLPSRFAGRVYLAVYGEGRSFHYGHYRIAARARPVDVLERLLEGIVETVRVTVVEGLLASELVGLCAAAGVGTAEQWHRAVTRNDLVRDIAPEASSLEGFLFPDTYLFAAGIPADEAAEHMVARFREVWRELSADVDGALGTPFETVILASLVEAETSVPEERARVAGVFQNRLDRGMLLQCDPTVVYALKGGGGWQGRLLRQHWLLDDPYNTYRYPGLPPGPINSPGRAALAAALEPESHSYLYFVARPGGGHTFSRTLTEHNRAVADLRRSRR